MLYQNDLSKQIQHTYSPFQIRKVKTTWHMAHYSLCVVMIQFSNVEVVENHNQKSYIALSSSPRIFGSTSSSSTFGKEGNKDGSSVGPTDGTLVGTILAKIVGF